MNQPIILRANRAHFPARSIVDFPMVQSRMLLWCTGNAGQVWINGFRYNLKPMDFLFLPWNHAIRYCAQDKSSFDMSGIHLIPHLPIGDPVDYFIYHSFMTDRKPQENRFDSDLPLLKGTVEGKMIKGSALHNIAEYILQVFERENRNEKLSRSLAGTLLYELSFYMEHSNELQPLIPGKLKKMLDYIENNYSDPVTLEKIAASGGCSPPTATRLFRRYLEITPVRWLQEKRIRKAAEILKTSALTSAEAAYAVGIDDPYYFSRLFKKIMGETVRSFRADRLIL